MKKSEIFNEILSTVCACAEVKEEEVLSSSRIEDVSSARCAIVGLCKEYGLSNKLIQEKLHFHSHGSVCYHHRQFVSLSESSRPFRFLLSSVRHELDKTLSVTCQ